MGLSIVDELQLMTGIDIPSPSLGLTFHQPRVKEIAILGEQDYFTALSIFSLGKEGLKIADERVSNWLIFNETLNQKIDGILNVRSFMRNFLQLFFISKINFGPRSLIIDVGDNKFINIDDSNFDIFQMIIKEIGGSFLLKPNEEVFKPANRRAAEIAEKMKKARAKLAKVQNAGRPQQKGFLKKYMKAVLVGTANSAEDVNNMTLYMLNEIMQTYLAWEAYDIEIKSRLAGAKGDGKIIHWIMKEDDPGIETV